MNTFGFVDKMINKFLRYNSLFFTFAVVRTEQDIYFNFNFNFFTQEKNALKIQGIKIHFEPHSAKILFCRGFLSCNWKDRKRKRAKREIKRDRIRIRDVKKKEIRRVGSHVSHPS